MPKHGDTACGKYMLNFAVNLNPRGAPPIVDKLIRELKETIESYPVSSGHGIKRFYSERFNLPEEYIVPGNGASELIYLLPRVLSAKSITIVEPTFSEYRHVFYLAGCRIESLRLIKESRFSIKPDRQMVEMIKKTDGILLCNPNNPTGTATEADGIIRLAEEMPEKWFILDESFVQFTGETERYSALKTGIPENIVIIHSLTKFYSLAGLRMGALITSNTDLKKRLERWIPPWNINGVADKAAMLLSSQREYEIKTLKLIAQQKSAIREEFESFKHIELYDSVANFFLAEYRKDNFDLFLRRLKKRGICVRDCRDFSSLDGNFFRFRIMREEENRALLRALSG